MNVLRFLVPKSLVVYIDKDSTVRQALEKMRYHRYVAIPVLDGDGVYVGTIRSDDILKYFLENGSVDFRAAERDELVSIMDPSYTKPLSHSAPLSDLIDYVKEHNFVPVVDDRGCFIGIVLRRDVLSFLFNYYTDKEKSAES